LNHGLLPTVVSKTKQNQNGTLSTLCENDERRFFSKQCTVITRMALVFEQESEHPVKRMKHSLSYSLVLFWKPEGVYGCLSNWSPHSVLDGKLKFKTMEHYMMYHKAILMGDNETASRIMEVKTPQGAKKLGREVRNFNEGRWQAARESVVRKGLMLKATQHSDVKDRLLSTSGKVLAEASPYDRVWGIGLSMTDARSRSQDQWRGENLLGKLWMQVREMLLPID